MAAGDRMSWRAWMALVRVALFLGLVCPVSIGLALRGQFLAAGLAFLLLGALVAIATATD